MDPVAGGGGVVVRRLGQSVDEQPRGFHLGQHVARERVVGQVDRGRDRDDLVPAGAQQDVTLTRAQGGEDLAGHPVGDRRQPLGQPLGCAHRVRGRPDGARSEHHEGRPPAGPPGDGVHHGRVVGAGVLRHQLGALGVVHPQQVAPQRREVAQELGDQPGEREVPPAQQQHAHGLGGLSEPPVDEGHRFRRQRMGVVDDHEPGSTGGRLACRRVEHLPEARRGPVGVGVDPHRGRGTCPRRVRQPTGGAQRLAGPGRRHHQRDGAVGVIEPRPEPLARHVDTGESGHLPPRRPPGGLLTTYRISLHRRPPPSRSSGRAADRGPPSRDRSGRTTSG